MKKLHEQGRVIQSKPGTVPRYKRYLDEMPGVPTQDMWDDLAPIAAHAKERLGYPTQKPLSLLERIVGYSSNPGDVVLDPFCGCGTALIAAQKLNRKWVGIDITHLAISTMKWRLDNMFPGIEYRVVGEPKDPESAKALADQNKYQFQWWAVSLIKGGQPYGDKKKGADSGIDGYVYFMDEKDKVKTGITSVKAGHVGVNQVRDLIGVVKRESAAIGLFVTLEQPTKPMEQEAILDGYYHSPLGTDYQKIQILTVEQLLQGKKPDLPPWVSPISSPGPSTKANKASKPQLL